MAKASPIFMAVNSLTPAEQYHARSASAITGDYNQDGIVNAADYIVWRDSRGATGTNLNADGTGAGGNPDGVVDALDYDFRKIRLRLAGANGVASTAIISEPASSVLLIGLAAAILLASHPSR